MSAVGGSVESVRNVTRNDVARLAGVSTAVVSYVINNGPRPVAADTRVRVLEAIDKLGYQPNAAARSLITGRADLVGFVVPDLGNAYFAGMAQRVEAACRERGLTLVLVQAGEEGLLGAVEALGGRMVEGIITATEARPDDLTALARQRARLVPLNLSRPFGSYGAVWPDYYGGARQAVAHLVEHHGHRRVAVVSGFDVPDDRERAWRDVLLENGLQPGPRIQVPWTMAGGREAARRLLAEDATAVFVLSDQQATGMMSGLHLAGCRVPDDLAVASFDGSPEAEFGCPPLTTVEVPVAQMAADVVSLVLGERPPERRTYPASLVVRQSCGCPPPREDAGPSGP